MTASEKIGRLMFRYIRNELTPIEKIELTTWRNTSLENEQLFQNAIDPEKIRRDMNAIRESRERIWESLQENRPDLFIKKPPGKLVIVWRVFRYAAIFIVLFIGSLLTYTYFYISSTKHDADNLASIGISFSHSVMNKFNRGLLNGIAGLSLNEGDDGLLISKVPDSGRLKHRYFRLYTSASSRWFLTFPDSTTVWLNAGSTIKYPSNMSIDTVHLFLNGESDVNIPFNTKHVYDIKISPPISEQQPFAYSKALADRTTRSIQFVSHGGRFHLQAFADDPSTTITQISGNIRVDSVSGKVIGPVTLEAGQLATLDSGNMTITTATRIEDLDTWKNNRITFHNTSIQTILRTVARWYDMTIVYHENIPAGHFNIDMRLEEDITKVLDVLANQGLHYRIYKDTIMISP